MAIDDELEAIKEMEARGVGFFDDLLTVLKIHRTKIAVLEAARDNLASRISTQGDAFSEQRLAIERRLDALELVERQRIDAKVIARADHLLKREVALAAAVREFLRYSVSRDLRSALEAFEAGRTAEVSIAKKLAEAIRNYGDRHVFSDCAAYADILEVLEEVDKL